MANAQSTEAARDRESELKFHLAQIRDHPEQDHSQRRARIKVLEQVARFDRG